MLCGGALKSLPLHLLSLSWRLVVGILWLDSLVILFLACTIKTAFWVALWTVAFYLWVLSPRRLHRLIVVFTLWPFPVHSLTSTFTTSLSAMSSSSPSSPNTKAMSIAKKIRLSDFQGRILQTSGICRGLILQFLSRAGYILAREITIRVLYRPLKVGKSDFNS